MEVFGVNLRKVASSLWTTRRVLPKERFTAGQAGKNLKSSALWRNFHLTIFGNWISMERP